MEGPSLVILRGELEPFLGKKVLRVSGNTKQSKELLKGRTLSQIDIWGKVLFLFFSAPGKKGKEPLVTKTHFLMFGSYRINDPKPERSPRLQLEFKNGIIYFYACSIQLDAQDYYENLDRKVNVLSESWDEAYVLSLMKKKSKYLLCDLLLDQNLFAGSGNIVKNEVLFNIRRHPLTKLSQLQATDWPKLIHAVRVYCENFYTWKKKFELRKHWQVYRQHKCPLCGEKLIKENLGKFHRKTFYCAKHQKLPKTKQRLTVHAVLPIKPSTEREAPFDH